MVTFKSIKNLSVNITEDEYRKMNAMHYSMLSRFSEGGFESIDHLDDPCQLQVLHSARWLT